MLQKITILVLSTNADLAGAPNHVFALISSLMHKVNFVAVFGERGKIAERLYHQGVGVEIVEQMRSEMRPINDLIAFYKLARLVANVKPDIIHAHSSKAGMHARLLSFFLHIPCVYTVHGWGWRGLNPFGAILVRCIERILSRVSLQKYIYVAASVERDAIEVLNIPKKKGSVIYNGINPLRSPRAIPTNCLKIIMPARVSAAKDHESLIRAFEQLSFPSRLILCGAETDSKDFMQNIQIWAPRRYCEIDCLGVVEDMETLLGSCDVLALISNFEALPISIIEAMSLGMAIIGTNIGGVPELIINESTGLLVDSKDIKGIKNALSRINDFEFRKRLSSSAQSFFHVNFTLDEMLKKVLIIYESECKKEINN